MPTFFVVVLIWSMAATGFYLFIRGATRSIDRQADIDAAEATAAGVLH